MSETRSADIPLRSISAMVASRISSRRTSTLRRPMVQTLSSEALVTTTSDPGPPTLGLDGLDGLDQTLQPFGLSRMMPAEAYTSDEVFAWEQRNLFAGTYTCVGREDE